MSGPWWTNWRRDLFVGLLASALTASVLVPLGWSGLRHQRAEADEARSQALQVTRAAEQKAAESRDRAQRNLIDQALNAFLAAGGDAPEAEVMRVTTGAVAPEVPQGAHLLIDKKAASYAAGDIVVFRVAGNNYLGRVVAVIGGNRLTVGRNGEAHREVAITDVIGRGVLNTR